MQNQKKKKRKEKKNELGFRVLTTECEEKTENTMKMVEVDPTGRYGRSDELLGRGSVKSVYRGFDMVRGVEVAWNQIKLRVLEGNEGRINQLYKEIKLIKTLRHENIIHLEGMWTNKSAWVLNFITDLCLSGNLREFWMRHNKVSLKAMKRWWKQILIGLNFLHTHEPCVIHRDLNCSNVFIDGHTGKLKLGDFGLATIVGKSHAVHTMIGTPEFIAPEIYNETYDELVDIYAFGMLVLEMVTHEIPYYECDTIAKIYYKVTAGTPPDSLAKVNDPVVKAFIVRCLGKPRDRPSAAELLKDPFFSDINGSLYPVPNPIRLQPKLKQEKEVDLVEGIASIFLD